MIQTSRHPWSKKGDFGRVLIIGGSQRYTGAPCLAGISALRGGVDLVTLIGHERAMNSASAYSLDLITIPLKDELESFHLNDILEEASHADAILIGSGLPAKSFEVIREIVSELEIPMVLDAGAIHAVSENIFDYEEKNLLLTPHAGEFKTLTNEKLSTDIHERENQVKYWAGKMGVTLLVKGHIDIISNGMRTERNISGNPFMTVGGTGDILAGMALAFLAQGHDPVDSALMACQKIGQAGDLLAEKRGASMIASDLLDFL